MLLVSKAKAAKMVRELLDLFLDMEVSTGTEVLHVVEFLCYRNTLILPQILRMLYSIQIMNVYECNGKNIFMR